MLSSLFRTDRASCRLIVGGVSLVAIAILVSASSIHASVTQHQTTRHSQANVKHKLRKSSHSSLRHSDSPAIAAERATQIQTALIQKGYLSGEPTGNWDGQTIAAMQRLQSDNGWQSKVTPDARALIKLGLGPAPLSPAAGSTAPSPPR